MKIPIALMAAVLAVSGSAHAEGSDPSSKTEQEIREAARRYQQAWNRGDVRAMANEYTNDATYLAADGTEAEGKKEITETITEEFTEGDARGTRVALDVDEIQMLGPNMALVDIEQKVTGMQGTGGSGAAPHEMHTVVVAVKEGKTWKVKALRSLPAPGEQHSSAVGGSGQQQQQPPPDQQPPPVGGSGQQEPPQQSPPPDQQPPSVGGSGQQEQQPPPPPDERAPTPQEGDVQH